MKRKLCVILMVAALLGVLLAGCSTEASQVSYNIFQEADNFNVPRRLTVINARTDTVLLELIGIFAEKQHG